MNTNYSIFSKIILFLSFLFVGASCTKEAEESKPETVQYLPAVVSSKSASQDMINEILGSNRINGSTSIDAVVAKYEGYDDLEFVYATEAGNTSEYSLFIYKNEELVQNFKLNLLNAENSLTAITDNGEVIYSINDNKITNIQVTRNNDQTESNSTDLNGTKGFFRDFLDCEEAIVKQAGEAICGGCALGEMVFTGACTAWIVCRGASIVGCTAYAVGQM